MIYKKALEKARRTGSISGSFKKKEPAGWTLAEDKKQDTQVCPTCRLVELDQEYIYSQRCISDISNPGEIESYKILRTRLHQRMIESNWNSLMITSARDMEGKTLTAINLALSFSKHYHHTVLLVDCDFRKQNVYKYLGYSQRLNLIDHLIDKVPLNDVMVRLGKEKIVVISGERTVDSGAELLSSSQMIKLFDELKNRYKDRIIIFDLPPVLLLADALASTTWVDCILMVVQFGKTSIKDVQKSLDCLPKSKFLGFTINRSKIHKNGYYKYSYRNK